MYKFNTIYTDAWKARYMTLLNFKVVFYIQLQNLVIKKQFLMIAVEQMFCISVISLPTICHTMRVNLIGLITKYLIFYYTVGVIIT